MTHPRDIRLLLSDVDGTLVTNDKQLTPAAIAAARALAAAGLGLAVTSSRPAWGMRMLVEPLDLTTPLGGFNGGLICAPDFSVLERHPIAPETGPRVVDFLLAQGLDVWIYTDDDWCVRDPQGAHVAREAFILQSDAKVVDAFGPELTARALKIVGVSDDFDRVAAGEAAAPTVLGATVSATRSAAHFLDVTNPLANKGYVVEALARRLGLERHEIATIGDMPNDVLMFRQGGYAIAMGNASDAVKAQADVVTRSNQDDGFAHAVEQLLLVARS
jgi:Cof subfamily protein (haloacid dehalogenase superfamily)